MSASIYTFPATCSTLSVPLFLFLSSSQTHLLFIRHTAERLSRRICTTLLWSGWTGNELLLNLAQTLHQAKVIKKNMNCKAPEKWRTPPPQWDKRSENGEKLSLRSCAFCELPYFEICFSDLRTTDRQEHLDGMRNRGNTVFNYLSGLNVFDP